jgi:hypothetical protein
MRNSEAGWCMTKRRALGGWALEGWALARLLASVVMMVAATLGIMLWARIGAGVDVRILLLDPSSLIVGWLPYTSAICYAGTLLWWASATVGMLGGVLLWHRQEAMGIARALVAMAALSAALTVDELFTVHREVAGALVRAVGMAETSSAVDVLVLLLFLPYVLAILLCVWRYWNAVAQSDVLVLCLAIAAFTVSALIDLASDALAEFVVSVRWGPDVTTVADELMELTGILFWFTYVTRTVVVRVRVAMRCPA